MLPHWLQMQGHHSIKEISWSLQSASLFRYWHVFACVLGAFHSPESYQISGQFLTFFQQGVLLIPSYGSLVIDTSPLQRLPPSGWEEMLGLWWNLFFTQPERHAHLVFCQLYGSIKAGYENILVPLKCLHILWGVISGTGSSLKAWEWYWKTCLVLVHSFLRMTQDTNMQGG